MALFVPMLFLGTLLSLTTPVWADEDTRREAVTRESPDFSKGDSVESAEDRDGHAESRRPQPKRRRDLSQLLLLWILQTHPLQ